MSGDVESLSCLADVLIMSRRSVTSCWSLTTCNYPQPSSVGPATAVYVVLIDLLLCSNVRKQLAVLYVVVHYLPSEVLRTSYIYNH